MKQRYMICPECHSTLYPHGPIVATHWMCAACGFTVEHRNLWESYRNVAIGVLQKIYLRGA